MTREKWYHFLIGGVLILLLYILMGRLLQPVLEDLLGNSSKISYFIGVNAYFTLLALSFLTIVYFYHKLTFKQMITSRSKIDFKRISLGFSLWFTILIVPLVVSRFTHTDMLIKSGNFSDMLPFLLLSLILTPIQTTIEELIFRSYLIKGMKSINRKFLFPLLGSSFLFAFLHMWNPEIDGKYVQFFMIFFDMALLLGFLTIKYKGIEYSLGIHFANNFFTINILNYKNSPLPSSSLYFADELSPEELLLSFIISGVIFLIVITIIERKNDKKHNL